MKQHYQTLDGLRGVAALAVFAFHLLELIFLKQGWNPLPRAYLAVDFFFCLSGFVIGYAYDGRLGRTAPENRRLSLRAFLERRLIRLQPMLVIGILLGAICYLANPFVGGAQQIGVSVGYRLFMANLALGLLLLPAPSLPNMLNFTHSLNGPAWSLLQEYLANLMYVLVGHRLGRWMLSVVATASAGVLLWMALKLNTMNAGATWSDWWGGPIRLVCSFSIGLLIQRIRLKFSVPAAFPLLSFALVALFAVPMVTNYRGLFDWLCVVAIFPAIIVIGAGTQKSSKVAETSGRLSYPLYMVHYPIVLLFAHWNWSTSPNPAMVWAAFAATMVVGVSFAWAVLIWVDEPVRAWLSRRAGHSQLAAAAQLEPDSILAQHLEWCRRIIAVNENTIEQLTAQNAHLRSVIELYGAGKMRKSKEVRIRQQAQS